MRFMRFITAQNNVFINIISKIQNTILPFFCIICGLRAQNLQQICEYCQQNLPILIQNCERCAQFLKGEANLLCGECLKNPPPFLKTYALFPYEFPITDLIIKLKFQHQLSHAKALGDMLTQAVLTHWYQQKTLPDLIIPVPLHRSRLRERGFNQAVEIAKPLAKNLQIPLDLQGIIRTKPTLKQSGLSAKERQRNLAHAFISTRDYTGLSVAVLDDVITTGYTVRSLCQTLRENGAENIHVWCCARCDIAQT